MRRPRKRLLSQQGVASGSSRSCHLDTVMAQPHSRDFDGASIGGIAMAGSNGVHTVPLTCNLIFKCE